MIILCFAGGRPDSRASHASVSSSNPSNRTSTMATGSEAVGFADDDASSLAEEGVKLSLFARAKAVEEQVRTEICQLKCFEQKYNKIL